MVIDEKILLFLQIQAVIMADKLEVFLLYHFALVIRFPINVIWTDLNQLAFQPGQKHS